MLGWSESSPEGKLPRTISGMTRKQAEWVLLLKGAGGAGCCRRREPRYLETRRLSEYPRPLPAPAFYGPIPITDTVWLAVHY